MRRSREEADELLDRNRGIIDETGLGLYALELKTTEEAIGFCGLTRTDLEPHLPDGTVEIGWRLAERFWGQGHVTEAAKALLIHAFDTLGLDEVVSFAVTTNVRSTSVMRRIGMRHDPVRDFNHPRVPDSHLALKRHVLYSISRSEWQALASRNS
ncbi:RimJ/RimL family protein N-acetyltransferase [Rhizobium sp. BK251]|nr:RimJ/RimL family protein N-acetyltransferase [Rhizobium sp. BK251]